MLSEAVEYPTNDDDWVVTVLIGGGINVAAAIVAFLGIFLFIIPFVGLILGPMAFLIAMLIPVPVAGFLVSVSRTLLEGETVPPQFEDWGDLFVDGLKVVAITVVYFVPWALIGLFWLVGAGIGGAIGSDAGGAVILLFTLVASLIGLVYAVVQGVLFPVSFVNFARTDRLGAAFDVAALRRTGTDRGYLKAWAIGAVGYLVASMIANSIPIVGLFVVFFAQMSIVYVFTRGAAEPLGVELDFEDGGDGDQSLEAFASSGDTGSASAGTDDAESTDGAGEADEADEVDRPDDADGSESSENVDGTDDTDSSDTA